MQNKLIIINADDFGLSDSVNNAVAEAFKKGLISDTTMLANGSAFNPAVALANERGFADKVGIHFNLTEGEPLTDEIKHCPAFCENGLFHNRINRLKPLNSAEKAAVYKELTAQAKKVKTAGLSIDHADSHHHIHTAVFIAPIVFRICREYGIDKIRIHRNIGNISSRKRIIKSLYNRVLCKRGFKTTDYFGSLADIANGKLPDNLEIMVHPDYDKDGVLIDRRGAPDPTPKGVTLFSVSEKFGVKLTSYGEI